MTEPNEVAKLLVDFKSRNPQKVMVTSFLGGSKVASAVSTLKSGGIKPEDTKKIEIVRELVTKNVDYRALFGDLSRD